MPVTRIYLNTTKVESVPLNFDFYIYCGGDPNDRAHSAAALAVGGSSGIRLVDLDVRRVAELVSLARGAVLGRRWAGPDALVPAAVGAVLAILGAGSVLLAAGCALLCLVTAAVAGAVPVARSPRLDHRPPPLVEPPARRANVSRPTPLGYVKSHYNVARCGQTGGAA